MSPSMKPKHAPPIYDEVFALGTAWLDAGGGDDPTEDDWMDPRYNDLPCPALDHAREQRAHRKGRRRLNPSEAWRVEAKRARALCLEAVRVANSISPPTGDWRRHGEAARPYFHAMHVAAQLLCKGTCAWARARVLAHTAGDGEGLAYCTRGLRAAQAAQRPPLWWQDVGPWREAQEGLCEAGEARVCARMPGCEGVLGVGLP